MMGVATTISVSSVFCVHLSSKDTSKNMQASLHSSIRTRHRKERGSFRRNVMPPLCLCSIFDSFVRPSSCTSTPLRHALRARSAVVRLGAFAFRCCVGSMVIVVLETEENPHPYSTNTLTQPPFSGETPLTIPNVVCNNEYRRSITPLVPIAALLPIDQSY